MTAVSLAHLTVLDLAPPEMVRVAARTGYDMVGLRLIPVTDTTPGYPLMRDPAMLRATRAALAETGLGVLDIEFVRITPEIDLAALEPFLAAGAALGARHIIAAPYDPDLARLSDGVAALADLAQPYGLRPVFEFFPWTSVPDLASAAAVVEATGRPGVGVLVDTLHFDRSGSRIDDLAALAPSRLPFLHLCDAPVRPPYSTEALLHAGRAERLPPGEGEIDLASILRSLPKDIPVALEVPMSATARRYGPEAVALQVRRAAERLLKATAA
jgi:sugar phosphate isomerase/epimerase